MREVIHPDEADKREGYKGWSTGWLANYRIFDGHEWTAARWAFDGATCGGCGVTCSNAEITRGEVPDCSRNERAPLGRSSVWGLTPS